MTPIYAISDVHGQFEQLAEALMRIESDGGRDARVVVLGDLVDRGPDSYRVIELLRLGIERGHDWTVLRGNHDQMFLDFLTEGKVRHPRIRTKQTWFDDMLGGKATLASYGVSVTQRMTRRATARAARAAVPDNHLAFLKGLPLLYETSGLLFVHAGIKPNVPLEKQDPEDLMWIREPFLSHKRPYPWMVVHGHTPLQSARKYPNRINLNAGAGVSPELTVGVFEKGAAYRLSREGRVPL